MCSLKISFYLKYHSNWSMQIQRNIQKYYFKNLYLNKNLNNLLTFFFSDCYDRSPSKAVRGASIVFVADVRGSKVLRCWTAAAAAGGQGQGSQGHLRGEGDKTYLIKMDIAKKNEDFLEKKKANLWCFTHSVLLCATE